MAGSGAETHRKMGAESKKNRIRAPCPAPDGFKNRTTRASILYNFPHRKL